MKKILFLLIFSINSLFAGILLENFPNSELKDENLTFKYKTNKIDHWYGSSSSVNGVYLSNELKFKVETEKAVVINKGGFSKEDMKLIAHIIDYEYIENYEDIPKDTEYLIGVEVYAYPYEGNWTKLNMNVIENKDSGSAAQGFLNAAANNNISQSSSNASLGLAGLSIAASLFQSNTNMIYKVSILNRNTNDLKSTFVLVIGKTSLPFLLARGLEAEWQ
jgi:hypothetical protein